MTREEAIKIIRREYSCVDRDCDIERSCGKCPYSMPSKEPILKAYCLAVEALEQIDDIKKIISSDIYIQEDVIRYKMICEVVK